MLVLTRKRDESIMIGDDIEVKVLEVRENHVKIGITAPREIAVHRREIYIAIQQENILAAQQQESTGLLSDLLKKRSGKKQE